MLDLKTCQALAAAYPEIRDHVFVEGDRFWRPPDLGKPDWTPELCWDDEPASCNWAAPAEGDIWNPLAGDLLPIARSRAAHRGRDIYLFTNWAHRWCFTDDPDLDAATAMGDTPEEAVAAWMLRLVRKEG